MKMEESDLLRIWAGATYEYQKSVHEHAIVEAKLFLARATPGQSEEVANLVVMEDRAQKEVRRTEAKLRALIMSSLLHRTVCPDAK